MAMKSNRAGGGPASRQVKNNQAGRKVKTQTLARSPLALSAKSARQWATTPPTATAR